MSSWIQKLAKEKGLRVEEGKKSIFLHVELKDSKKGTLRAPQDCGFAQCAKREIPGLKNAYFFRTVAFLEYKDRIVRYTLPTAMQREIAVFDRAKMLAPGTHEMLAPSGSHTMKAARERNAPRKGRHQPKGTTIRRSVVKVDDDIRKFSDTARGARGNGKVRK